MTHVTIAQRLRLLLLTTVPASICCISCAHEASQATPSTTASAQPSKPSVVDTRPAQPPTLAVAPIDPQLALLLTDQNAYLTTEGSGHRGRLFEQVCGRLMLYFHRQPSLTLEQTFALLGLPDCGDVDASGAEYVYFYDRFGSKDWSILVSAQDDRVTQISVNATSANDFSKCRRYKDWMDVQLSPPGHPTRGWIGQLFL